MLVFLVEKKRNEILQMKLLEPRLSILDETDSGLDIDDFKNCCRWCNIRTRMIISIFNNYSLSKTTRLY